MSLSRAVLPAACLIAVVGVNQAIVLAYPSDEPGNNAASTVQRGEMPVLPPVGSSVGEANADRQGVAAEHVAQPIEGEYGALEAYPPDGGYPDGGYVVHEEDFAPSYRVGAWGRLRLFFEDQTYQYRMRNQEQSEALKAHLAYRRECFSMGNCPDYRSWPEASNPIARFLQYQTYRYRANNFRRSRSLAGQSTYLPSPPIDDPAYGYYATCWRQFPGECFAGEPSESYSETAPQDNLDLVPPEPAGPPEPGREPSPVPPPEQPKVPYEEPPAPAGPVP